MSSFEVLPLKPAILKGVLAAGYVRPFPIQAQAIGPLLEGKNLIGQAKAGSGKTLAFGIPLVQAVDASLSRVQALVLAPTRELAVQITLELQKIGSYTAVRVVTIYGGQSMNVQLEALRKGAHIVVGTPGRTIDHIKRGTLRLDSVKFVVIDEADVMLDMGFIEDVDYILDKTPSARQTALFSATMPRSIVQLSQRYVPDPIRVMVDENEPSAETLEQFYARIERDKKLQLLMDILEKENRKSAVVFCRTRHGTIRLARELERRFLSVVSLHGDLTQKQRDHSMGLFRAGKADVLVATDVASRGIDVRQVDCVINYDVPEDPTVYFHRVGRTARAGDVGRSYTFVSWEEEGDFARIAARAKAPIKPLREEDARKKPRPALSAKGTRPWRHGRRERDRGRPNRWRRYH
ncbi:MAG: DEAD/DEAH box helicase [Nitrososphaerota archaeon]|nr:DEAD/DEAH box helicase [Nitrososphaerota archaeon]MDG6941727.1 DEAD/DEAH box helicase [Nitrososphaerota archaeon]MDG6947100.1 DEAD/DEAH box helicase [Nitrososphaerota archaeon]MDG6951351.1 DEAD/DEAH box helicase [Nitrososphaerota archaeon]